MQLMLKYCQFETFAKLNYFRGSVSLGRGVLVETTYPCSLLLGTNPYWGNENLNLPKINLLFRIWYKFLVHEL